MSNHIVPKGFMRAMAYTFGDAADILRTTPEPSKNKENMATLLEGVADGLRIAVKARRTKSHQPT